MILNLTAMILIRSYDATKPLINLNEEYTKIVAGAVAFPFNIPGTAFHKCLKVMEKKKPITVKISLKIFRSLSKTIRHRHIAS